MQETLSSSHNGRLDHNAPCKVCSMPRQECAKPDFLQNARVRELMIGIN